jgi:hypothetical protein
LPQRALGSDFADSVVERLRNESLLRPFVAEPSPRARRISWRISGPIAAAAALLLVVWLVRYEPHRTVASRGAITNRANEANVLATDLAADQDQLDVGDSFDVFGPDGECRFQLIVFTKESEDNFIRCILVDRSDQAGPQDREDESTSSGAPPPPNQPTRALQADQDQIDALARAYDQANSHADEPAPVVDIFASAAPNGLSVGSVTPHVRPEAAASTIAAADQPAAAAQANNGALDTLAGPAELQPPARVQQPVVTDGSRSRNDADNALPAVPESDVPEPQRAKDGPSRLAAKPERTAPGIFGTTFRIQEIQVKLDDGPLGGTSEPETAAKPSAPATTREGVGKLATRDERRVGSATGNESRRQPGNRVQFLVQLRFRENSEPEKSDR